MKYTQKCLTFGGHIKTLSSFLLFVFIIHFIAVNTDRCSDSSGYKTKKS